MTRRDPFQAIADPTRRAILGLIAKESLNLNSVAGHFKVSRPAISKHIKILSQCGLIEIRQQGRERFCEARLEGLGDVATWLGDYRQFWDTSFVQDTVAVIDAKTIVTAEAVKSALEVKQQTVAEEVAVTNDQEEDKIEGVEIGTVDVESIDITESEPSAAEPVQWIESDVITIEAETDTAAVKEVQDNILVEAEQEVSPENETEKTEEDAKEPGAIEEEISGLGVEPEHVKFETTEPAPDQTPAVSIEPVVTSETLPKPASKKKPKATPPPDTGQGSLFGF